MYPLSEAFFRMSVFIVAQSSGGKNVKILISSRLIIILVWYVFTLL